MSVALFASVAVNVVLLAAYRQKRGENKKFRVLLNEALRALGRAHFQCEAIQAQLEELSAMAGPHRKTSVRIGLN